MGHSVSNHPNHPILQRNWEKDIKELSRLNSRALKTKINNKSACFGQNLKKKNWVPNTPHLINLIIKGRTLQVVQNYLPKKPNSSTINLKSTFKYDPIDHALDSHGTSQQLRTCTLSFWCKYTQCTLPVSFPHTCMVCVCAQHCFGQHTSPLGHVLSNFIKW